MLLQYAKTLGSNYASEAIRNPNRSPIDTANYWSLTIPNMYPSSTEQLVLAAAEKLMVATMARYDPSHDMFHGMAASGLFASFQALADVYGLYSSVRRVRKTALSLARSLSHKNPDLLVVDLAALLHDVLDKKYVSAAEAADPYAYFLPFFQSLGKDYALDLISDGRAALIVKIVENVSWTTENKLRESGKFGEWHTTCIELHCVQDADRLDAIGAFGGSQIFSKLGEHRPGCHITGIMRCAAYSAAVNQWVRIIRSLTYVSHRFSDLCTPHRVVVILPFSTSTTNFSIYRID